MSLTELFILAVGVSMDAFAVAVCKGLCLSDLKFKDALTVGLWFGIFQAGMPLIGYILGAQFREQITAIDHWIAFILLSLIGGNMIVEACSEDEKDELCCRDKKKELAPKTMLVLAVATSIDALAVGITFAFLDVAILPAVSFIGAVTLVCSVAGVYIGHRFGLKLKTKAEITGGAILVLMGTKILLEHLGIINI